MARFFPGSRSVPVPASSRGASAEGDTSLARRITPGLLLLFIIGDILGGGIYALVGEVGAKTGGAIWAAFLLALIAAAFTAGSYAELVSKYPRAGGAGLFVHRAFGNRFLSFVIAFAVAASGIASASTLARAFGGDYLSEFVDLEIVAGALILLTLVTVVNLRGISESVKLNVGLTLVEVGGLLLIVLIAVVAVIQGDADTSRPFEFKQGESIFAATLAGAALAFYALIGFEDSANVAEETKSPAPTYPRALFLGLAIAGVIYLLVTISATAVVPVSDLTGSDGPLLEVVRQGPLAIPEKLFSAIGLLALANGALINMIMASRLLYGMSEEGVVPPQLGLVLAKRRTPWAAILLTTVIAMVLIVTAELEKLADTTVALLVIVFAVVNITVLYLRRDPVEHDHFQVPSVLPIMGVGVSMALLTQIELEVFARAGVLVAVGVGLWLVNELLLRKPPGAGDLQSGVR